MCTFVIYQNELNASGLRHSIIIINIRGGSRAGGLGGAPQLTRMHTNPIPTRTHAQFVSTPRPDLHFWISSSSFIIIRQPLCPLVGRRHQHAVSKLPCLVLPSAISCSSSICPGRLSTAWLVSLVVFSCHNLLWSPSGDTRGPSVVFEAVDMPCPGPFFSQCKLYLCLLSSP